jgi:LacI family transcriptional regulator
MATISQVAALAGVSPTTVSHVINDTRYVSSEVRLRVQQAMDELGYQPNALARSLRRGVTHTLGLILPDSSNPFFAEVAQSLEVEAFDQGYNVILCNAEGSPSKERLYLEVLQKRQVDGLILLTTGEDGGPLSQAPRPDVPIVMLDRDLPTADADVVLADNRLGAVLATAHLLQLGHRRIGCISGPSHITPSARRVSGYMDGLAEAGIPFDETLVVRGDFHPESGRAGAHTLLDRPDRPTAIFACNDLMAIGAVRGACELGLSVPADLSIAGFDDIQLASYITPSLTTVVQPKTEMARTAVRLLLERMAERSLPARRQVLLPTLVVRESSRACQLKGGVAGT